MKTEIKIGIIEDELLIAEKIKHILTEFGYTVCEPCSNYEDALEMIRVQKPDLLLLDINLRTKKDGIDIAQKVNESFRLPFIFLTANSDSATIERAKKVNPFAYLVKPFTKEELFASIEIAFNHYMLQIRSSIKNDSTKEKQDFIFIRDNYRFIKISFNEIIYVESRENYVVIHTTAKKETILRSTFTDFLLQLPAENFCRVHRSYAVNISLIENIEPTEITVAGYKIPGSNSYRSALFSKLGIEN